MIINFLKTETFLMIVAGMNILLLILYFCNILKLKKINKNYKIFMKKIGNGNNIDEILKNYIVVFRKKLMLQLEKLLL